MKSDMRRHFRVAGESYHPYLTITKGANGEDVPRGPMQNVLDILSEGMNFSYDFIRPPDGKWGSLTENGTFNGMVGMLERDEADILLGPADLSYERSKAMNYVSTLGYERVQLLLKRPVPVSDPFGFITPFEFKVWIGLVVAMFLFAIIIHQVLRLDSMVTGKGEQPIMSKVLFEVVRSTTLESSRFSPPTTRSRLVFGSWLIFAFILGKSYEGTLTSMLSIPKIDSPINSVRDLINQKEMPWKLQAGHFGSYSYFKESIVPDTKAVYDLRQGDIPSCQGNYTRIVRGEFATICDSRTVRGILDKDFSETGVCNLYAPQNHVIMMQSTVGVNLKLDISSEISGWILSIVEAGLYEKWMQDETRNASYCVHPPTAISSSNKVLDMTTFSGIFLILVTGNSIAFLVFLLELLKGRKM